MARSNKHQPKKKSSIKPFTGKIPKSKKFVSHDQKCLRWCFSHFDRKDWHDDTHRGDSFNSIGKHLRDFQGLTWADIKRKEHPIKKDRLVREAQNRLGYLKQDDCDEVWRLQFAGLPRLWGIRHEDIFLVLWWDPQHKICPSQLKCT